MEDDITVKNDSQSTATEVDKVYAWKKSSSRRAHQSRNVGRSQQSIPQVWEISPPTWTLDTGTQVPGDQAPTQRQLRRPKTICPRYNTPRPQNTTVANQAYIFNGTTPHASVNYAPETFSMRAPFSTYHQAPYGYQSNQQQSQPSQQRVNSFTQDQNNSTPQTDTVTIIDQIHKLLNTHKRQTHQVNKVKVAAPKASTTWDLNSAAEVPQGQKDKSE